MKQWSSSLHACALGFLKEPSSSFSWLSTLFTEDVRRKPGQGSAQRMRECWVEFSGLTLAPILAALFGKPGELEIPSFPSPSGAYTPMAVYRGESMVLGVQVYGDLACGYLHPPDLQEAVCRSSGQGLTSLLIAKVSAPSPAGAGDLSADRWGCGSDALVSASPSV